MHGVEKAALIVAILAVGSGVWTCERPERDQPIAGVAPEDELTKLMLPLGMQRIATGPAAANFVLEELAGTEFDLAESRGTFVFLNFWTTWCPPCVEEMPAMQVLHDELAAEGFGVVAVNIEEDRDTVQAFVDRTGGYTYPIVLDRNGAVAIDYAVRGLPATYFIGPDGRILGRLSGPRHWDDAATLERMRGIVALAAAEANAP